MPSPGWLHGVQFAGSVCKVLVDAGFGEVGGDIWNWFFRKPDFFSPGWGMLYVAAPESDGHASTYHRGGSAGEK